MPTVRASLPENLGCGGWPAMLLVCCGLLAMNGYAAYAVIAVMEALFSRPFDHRFLQIVLFALPLILLVVELRIGYSLLAMLRRRTGGES